MAKSGCGKLGEKALMIDAYGRPFEFILPNGARRYKTLVGSILTVITVIVAFLYTVYKFQLMNDRDQVNISYTSEEGYFDSNESILSPSSDFNIAFGIFKHGKLDERLQTNFSEYGELIVYETKNTDGENTRPIQSKLQTVECSSDHIALKDEDSEGKTFFTVSNPQRIRLNTENRAKL